MPTGPMGVMLPGMPPPMRPPMMIHGQPPGLPPGAVPAPGPPPALRPPPQIKPMGEPIPVVNKSPLVKPGPLPSQLQPPTNLAIVPPGLPGTAATDKKQTTLYVGKMPPDLDDGLIRSVLEACGRVVSWKRMQDPGTGKFKNFG